MSLHKRGEAGQKKHVRPGLKPKALVLAVAACFGMSAQANPTAPVVVHGSASFATAGNILNVTNSANAIINWGSFSIGANELTRFIQPSALSAVLNRVTGQDPSAILGALQSNGRVFLVNPNGIMFGAGAQIDVAGLVASTLNLSNDDFLNNRMRFTDGAGAGNVLNQGNITGGNVYLVGKAVTNDGLINTPNGEVLLAAGNSVELVNPGTPNLRVEIVAPDNEARNLGSIAAEAGRVGIYAGLIQQGGLINANSAVAEGGRILLKAAKNTTLDAGSQTTASGASGGSITIQSGDTTLAAGSIEARGGSGAGGTVQVLGNKVGLTGNAAIDASGETGGGTVLVGGDYQGKNPEVQNAYRTYVGEDVSIRADAVTQGDGGKVIVWADDTTRYYGNISARGGAVAGNGGFAEVSGKHNLDFRGSADLGAPMGQVGTLLLDPDFISIDISGLDPLPVIGLGPELGYLFADPGAYGGPSISIDPMLINAAAANVILQANE
ncbi:MAG: filamentous hemagglutinin N-terminal domain-containing protein, partial [Burkholderiales bacterium]